MGNLIEDEYAHLVREKLKPDTINMKMAHIAMGLCGEAGEFSDCMKKHAIYGQDLDVENAIEELGDIEFYLEAARQMLGVSREDVLQANIDKLSKRYKKGFTTQESAARADKQEVDPANQGD